MSKKRIISLMLVAIMVFTALPVTPALAATASKPSEYEIQIDDSTTVIAAVPEEYQSLISEQDIIDIAVDEGLRGGERINIHYVETAEAETAAAPRFVVVNTYSTTLTKVGSEYAANNYFVISVAKGQTVTLEKAFSQTVTASVSGSPYSVTAELTASVTASYKITEQFAGPPESSSYNSREYRVRFYAQSYNYSQDHYMSGLYIGTKTGTVNKPTRWASYSIDSNQS